MARRSPMAAPEEGGMVKMAWPVGANDDVPNQWLAPAVLERDVELWSVHAGKEV